MCYHGTHRVKKSDLYLNLDLRYFYKCVASFFLCIDRKNENCVVFRDLKVKILIFK